MEVAHLLVLVWDCQTVQVAVVPQGLHIAAKNDEIGDFVVSLVESQHICVYLVEATVRAALDGNLSKNESVSECGTSKGRKDNQHTLMASNGEKGW